jgi:nitric oxide reductase NorE protein
VFILGDMSIFALFFGIIETTRGRQTGMFRESQRLLEPDIAVVNTLLLLTGSWLVARALHGLRRGGRASTGRGHPTALLAGALACAAGFAALKSTEYVRLVAHGHTPATNDFFMYYFVFTGIHLAHLAIGAALLVTMLVLSRQRGDLSPGRIRLAEGGACIWHMVDLLWLLLFPLLYVVR